MAYVATYVLFVLGSALVLSSTMEMRNAERTIDHLRAFQWAEAGLDDASRLLNDPANGYWSNCTGFTAPSRLYSVECISQDPYRILRSRGFESAPGLSETPLSRQVEAVLRRFVPPEFYENAIYAADQVILNGNAYGVLGNILSGNTVPIDNTDHVSGNITQDPAASPLPALDFAQLYTIAQGQGNVYDANRLAAIQQNQDAFPMNFCYDGGTAPNCVPNVNYVTTDLLLNGNIGTIGGFFVVVGSVLTDPNAEVENSILNGNGQVEGVIYTTGQFRVNGGGGNLNISGGILSGGIARLNGNATVEFNAAYMDAIENLHINPTTQVVFWRECPPSGC